MKWNRYKVIPQQRVCAWVFVENTLILNDIEWTVSQSEQWQTAIIIGRCSHAVSTLLKAHQWLLILLPTIFHGIIKLFMDENTWSNIFEASNRVQVFNVIKHCTMFIAHIYAHARTHIYMAISNGAELTHSWFEPTTDPIQSNPIQPTHVSFNFDVSFSSVWIVWCIAFAFNSSIIFSKNHDSFLKSFHAHSCETSDLLIEIQTCSLINVQWFCLPVNCFETCRH